MKLRCLFFIVTYLYSVSTLLAFVDKEVLKKYKTAKAHYASLDYAAAKATLAPLISVEEKNDITPYALFYYALSAYYNNEPDLAENTFVTLVETHSDWEQKDEVWYWLGQLSFEAKDYRGGLARLANIKDKKLEKPLKQIKTYFLRQLDDIVTLQKILEEYPRDRELASVLFDKIIQQPLISRDLELLDTLTHDFDFNSKVQDPLQEIVSLKKDNYNVGVFFPFFVDEVDYEEESSNLFVVALYEGIKAAVAVLAKQGIKVNLFAYDTKKDSVTTASLLEQEEVKGLDLIIGPLYAPTIPLVAEFARTHRINFFNPLSENTEVVGNNAFAYLFKSSLETQARKAAEFTLQNSGNKLNVGIIYGASKAETIQAHIYQQCIERSTGKGVALTLSITPEEAQNALHTSKGASVVVDGREQETGNRAMLDLEGLTHIYVPSRNELIVAYLLSTVETLKHPPCIIGHETWLRQNTLTFDQLKRLRLCFVAPNYIDYEQEGIYTFRRIFYGQFAQYPDYYACTGYELMLFLGHMLDKYGVYFQKHWDDQFHQGVIFEGVAYGVYHDNQQVPIVKFQKNQLVTCHKTVLDK